MAVQGAGRREDDDRASVDKPVDHRENRAGERRM